MPKRSFFEPQFSQFILLFVLLKFSLTKVALLLAWDLKYMNQQH